MPHMAFKAVSQPTLAVHAAAPHFRFNEYIRSGYRPVSSPLQCFLGFFTTLSNETFNVLTHFLPLLAFAAMVADDEWASLGTHYTVVRVFLGCAAFTMFGSVCYHLFMAACGSKASYDSLLLFDVVGIWILGVSVCTMTISLGYLVTPWAAKASVLAAITGPSLWKLTVAGSAKDRGLAFAIIASCRVVVTLVRFVWCPASSGSNHLWFQPSTSAGAGLLITADAVMVVAGLINVYRFPEKHALSTGWNTIVLDYFGNSHQLMHILAVVAIYLTYLSGLADCAQIDADPALAAAVVHQFPAVLQQFRI
jgi:hypothetical protein